MKRADAMRFFMGVIFITRGVDAMRELGHGRKDAMGAKVKAALHAALQIGRCALGCHRQIGVEMALAQGVIGMNTAIF
jgi:hypothetical protein